ncbi:hypothetical protein [Stenotrophomonas sp. C1657]|uniref:hypothetical protein n=1 Tax=Stenotrophomonas sp. C1657 TaxID=3077844 RepID=UPI00293D1BDF|nr:hypothetical protein [Stenotrophomonas sp. C1657]MDV3513105.1 hypothetical protein [Stenotrophomonas sp. C1657]
MALIDWRLGSFSKIIGVACMAMLYPVLVGALLSLVMVYISNRSGVTLATGTVLLLVVDGASVGIVSKIFYKLAMGAYGNQVQGDEALYMTLGGMAILYQVYKHVRKVWFTIKQIPDPNDEHPTV